MGLSPQNASHTNQRCEQRHLVGRPSRTVRRPPIRQIHHGRGGLSGDLAQGEVAMGKEIRTQPCPECGGVMKYEKHDDLLEYKGQRRTIKTLGWWCSHCKEAILTGEPLLAHEQAFQELKAEVDQ